MTLPSPSFNDLLQIATAEALLRDPSLALLPGDVSDAMLHAIAAAADAAVRQADAGVRRTFLDGAQGQDLDTLVDDHFGLPRVDEVKSIGTMQVSRPGPTGPAFTFPIGHRFTTIGNPDGTRVVIELTQAIPFALNELGPKTGAARAVVAGPAGDAAAGTVTTILDATTDATFVATNPAAFVGGSVAESDAVYRARARQLWTVQAKATLGAIVYGAFTVPQVKVATVSESPTGLATLYVSDINGASNAQMVADVTTAMEQWRAAGVTLQVVGGVVQLVSVQYRVTLHGSVSPVPYEPIWDAAMRNAVLQLGVGETLYGELLRAAVVNAAPPGLVRNVTLLAPATDTITPAANAIIRLDTISRVA